MNLMGMELMNYAYMGVKVISPIMVVLSFICLAVYLIKNK